MGKWQMAARGRQGSLCLGLPNGYVSWEGMFLTSDPNIF